MRSRAVAVLKPLTWGRGSGSLIGLHLAPHLLSMILQNLVFGPSTRLAAGTLVLALPLVAAAGCGVEKRRTVTAEFASAQSNLARSRAVSFTVRLDDSKGSIKRLATKDKSTPKGLVDAALPRSVTYTVDPASNATLASLGSGACSGKTTTDLTEIAPLAMYLTTFQVLTKGFSVLGAGGATDALSAPTDAPTATGDCKAVSKVGTDVFAAIKPYVKVTDAGDSSSDRVLNIKVKARPERPTARSPSGAVT